MVAAQKGAAPQQPHLPVPNTFPAKVQRGATLTAGECPRAATELRVKAQAAMQRRLEAGISDEVEDLQPDVPPPFDQALVGKRIEVLWKYFHKDTKEPVMIWATGRVARVADGLSDKRSARARKILPAGALLWAWDADSEYGEVAGEQWLILLPNKWKTQQLYGWRWDPRELTGAAAGARGEPAREPRPRNVIRVDE